MAPASRLGTVGSRLLTCEDLDDSRLGETANLAKPIMP